MNSKLTTSVDSLSGVGPQTAEKLARMHVHTVQDVLFHLPSRYEDRTKVSAIGSLTPSVKTVIIGQIELAQVTYGRRRSLLVRVSDGTGSIVLRFFYFSRAQQKALQRGDWVRCFGEVRRGANSYEMVHPEYRVSAEQPHGALSQTLTPVYPTIDGLSQLFWRKITDQVLKKALNDVTELLPASSLPKELQIAFKHSDLQSALQQLHRPEAGVDIESLHNATSDIHQRLIFEELLGHHLSLRKARANTQREYATKLESDENLSDQFKDSLPFQLTGAQQRVCDDVTADLRKDQPMMRLVQGDVGSGKTVVAAQAILQAVANNKQALLIAPTELLAEQHCQTLRAWFAPLGIEVGWLANKTPAKERKATLEKLVSGELLVVAGTHALFQEAVQYHDLGLVVIDEQHRFGVGQRLALRNKSKQDCAPHQLMMTATPIPRTLAMSFYADLDVSNIDELPPGRKVVDTVVLSAAQKRNQVIGRIYDVCQKGSQVYWVCPFIEESDEISAQAATDVAAELSEALPDLNIALIHGRLKAKEKETVMQQFRDGNVDVLVSTTVIEVGVDVPNASLMVIENAERMGLAQLHQLRGRVGRGSDKAYCILLYQEPLSQHAKMRLQTMRETNDGFEIAEKDLAMRGAGELLGTRQTGSFSFKVADLMRDQTLLPLLPVCATLLDKQAPQNVEPLIERWVGKRQDYINA